MDNQDILNQIELFKKTTTDKVPEVFPNQFQNFTIDFFKFVEKNPNFNKIALFNEKNVYSLNKNDSFFELFFLQILFLDKNFFNEYLNYNFKNIFFALTIYSKEYYDYRNCFIYYKVFNYLNLKPLKYFEAIKSQLTKIKSEVDKLIPSDLQNSLPYTIIPKSILNLDFTITELREQVDNQIKNYIQDFKKKNLEEFINKIDYSIGIKYKDQDLYILKKIQFINNNKDFYDILKYLIFCFDNSALQTTLNQMYDKFKSLDIFDLEDEYTENGRFIIQHCEIFIKTTFNIEIYLKNIKINLNRIILYTFFIYIRTFINNILNENFKDTSSYLKNLLLEIALYNFISNLKKNLFDNLKIKDEQFITIFLSNRKEEIDKCTYIYINDLNEDDEQAKKFKHFLRHDLNIENYDHIYQKLFSLGFNASTFTDLTYNNFLELKNIIIDINNSLLSNKLLAGEKDNDLIYFIKKWSIDAYNEYFFNLSDEIVNLTLLNELLSLDNMKLILLEYININDENFNKKFFITDFSNVSQKNSEIINESFKGIQAFKIFIIIILDHIIKNLFNLPNPSLFMKYDNIHYVQTIFKNEKDGGIYNWIQGFIKALLINFNDDLIKQYPLYPILIYYNDIVRNKGLIFPSGTPFSLNVPLIQNSSKFGFNIPSLNYNVDSLIYIAPKQMLTVYPILDKLTYNGLLLDDIIGKYINFKQNYYNILLFYCPLTDNKTLEGYTIWDFFYQSAYFGNFYQNPEVILNSTGHYVYNNPNENMLTLYLTYPNDLTYPNGYKFRVSFNNSETAFQYCKFIRLKYILDVFNKHYGTSKLGQAIKGQLSKINNFNTFDGPGAIREKRSVDLLNVYDPFYYSKNNKKYSLKEDFSYGLSSDLSGSFINSSLTYKPPKDSRRLKPLIFSNTTPHNFFVKDRDYMYLSGVSPYGTQYNMFKIIELLYDQHFNVKHQNSHLLSNIDALDINISYLNNIKIMYLIIFKKFTNRKNKYFDNNTLLTRIKNSKEYYLIEHNLNYDVDLHWSDNVMGNGLNLLGELSMILSEHLSVIANQEGNTNWPHITLRDEQFYKIYSKFDSMKKQKYFANNLPGDNIILRLNAIFTKQYYFNHYNGYNQLLHPQIYNKLIKCRKYGETYYIEDIAR